MQHTDLTRYFGLKFVTSSLEKKAEAAAIKARLDQDSTQVPVDSMEEKESIGSTSGDEVVDSGKKRLIRASVAYEIAASAASYVQSKAKNMFSSASELEPEDSGENGDGEGEDEEEEEGEEGESLPRVYKSEVAAYMAASTMTAVVAACEKEKSEAAKDLQSLHSSPCEWFVCDDSNTRCFVIQVINFFQTKTKYIYLICICVCVYLLFCI